MRGRGEGRTKMSEVRKSLEGENFIIIKSLIYRPLATKKQYNIYAFIRHWKETSKSK